MSHCIWSDPQLSALPQETMGAMVPDEPLNHLCDLWARHFTSTSSSSAAWCSATKNKNFPGRSTCNRSSLVAEFSGGEKVSGWVKTRAEEAWGSILRWDFSDVSY